MLLLKHFCTNSPGLWIIAPPLLSFSQSIIIFSGNYALKEQTMAPF